MFEVFENEGWKGYQPSWYATDGEEPSVTFDTEEEAQEYCDEKNAETPT
jgi:viroplasmin and RNaseH domain-containing protein